jgi:hypothetical protein
MLHGKSYKPWIENVEQLNEFRTYDFDCLRINEELRKQENGNFLISRDFKNSRVSYRFKDHVFPLLLKMDAIRSF